MGIMTELEELQNFIETNPLDRLSSESTTDLDRALSQLFDLDPLHPVLKVWIEKCRSLSLAECSGLQDLCFRLSSGYNQLGKVLYDLGDRAAALDSYEWALVLCPSKDRVGRSRLYFNRGILLVQTHNLSEALASFETAIACDREFAPAHYQRERVAYELESQAKPYRFTHDWFSRNIPLLAEHISVFTNLPNLHFLEVGSWEGRSTCWFLEKILTHVSAQITCIDTFEGEGYLNLEQNILQNVEDRFDWNIAQTGMTHKVQKRIGRSQSVLRNLPLHTYDSLYIDGSHLALDALSDAVIGWDLVKKEGLIVFDDYDKVFPDHPTQNTHLAVDAFMTCFAPSIEIVHQSHQVILRKK
jgi:tetratricopeptide (TPR) repeat protein